MRLFSLLNPYSLLKSPSFSRSPSYLGHFKVVFNFQVHFNLSSFQFLFLACATEDQGGIFQGNQGARFPRNLQAHTKFLLQFTLFCREFDIKIFLYFLLNEEILPISHNIQKIFSYHRKKHLGTENYLLSQE